VWCELTGNWEESPRRVLTGFRRIEPLGSYRALTKEQHIVFLAFEVVLEPCTGGRDEQGSMPCTPSSHDARMMK
jgi:hypothetical protein